MNIETQRGAIQCSILAIYIKEKENISKQNMN